MKRFRSSRRRSSLRKLLILGACLAAARAWAAQDPALEKNRVELTVRIDQWSDAALRDFGAEPDWRETMLLAVARAKSLQELADLSACLEDLKSKKTGCLENLPAAAKIAPGPGASATAAGRTALAAAHATADNLGSTPWAYAAIPPAEPSPHAPAAAPPAAVRLPAAAPPPALAAAPPVPGTTFTERTIGTIADVWDATLDAGRTAAATSLAAAKKVGDFLSAPTPDPLQGERQKLLMSYAGLGPLLRPFAPDLQDQYSQLMSRVTGAKEAAALQGLEGPLKDLKGRVLAAVRSSMEAERAAALAQGRTFDLLAALRAKASPGADGKGPAPFQRLSMTPSGRLQVERDPSWSSTEWDRYVYWQLPVEAEIVLNTKFPVVSVDRTQGEALVFRGEDYGVDGAAKADRAELDARTAAASKAAGAEKDARSAAAQAERDVLAAQATRTERKAKAAAAAAAAAEADLRAGKTAADAAAAERDAQAAEEAAQADRGVSAEEIRAALMKSAAGIDLEILFAFNSAELSPQALPQLSELGKALAAAELKGRDILIYGHTDARGGAAYNLNLSQRRAESVKDYLIAHAGLPSEKLTAQGFGFQRLKVPDQPFSEKNRRVQIAVKGAGDAAAIQSDLEARAAQTQAELKARAAEKAQAAAEKAQTAADAADAKLTAAETAAQARRDAAAAEAALAAARAKRDALTAAVPAATAAKLKAEAAAAGMKPLVDRAEEQAQGAVYVRDFRANHYSWFGAPRQLAERITETLNSGFTGYGADGAAASRLFERVNPATDRTLAQDIAQEMERREAQKGNFQVFREQVGDMLKLLDGRWVDVIGHVGRGGQFSISGPVPGSAEKRNLPAPPPVPVSIISAAEFAKLSPRTSPSAAPSAAAAPASAEPAPAKPAANAADEAALLQDRRNVEAAAEAARVRTAAALQARRLSDQAAASAAAAAKARRDAETAARTAQAKEASAAQIREALIKNAESASIDLEILFAYGSARIREEAVPQLSELGKALSGEEFKGLNIFIYGHTDARGGAAYNLDLSRRRAESVKDYLLANFPNLSGERLTAQGFGFQRLKVPDQPFSEKNRRVQIGILR